MTTLRERIAALEKRNAASSPSVPATSTPSSTPSNSSAGRLKSVRDVASRFDEIGGAPIPRGSFGLGAPASAGPKVTKSRELYGNRIPKPRNVSASGSPSRSPGRLVSTPGDSQAGSEMGDEDWEERASERSASPNGDHIDHQQHSSHSRSNSPSHNTPDVHDEDEPTHTSEQPIIAVSTGEGAHVSSEDSTAVPAAAVHQPLPPSPEVELATPDEPVAAEPSAAAEIPAPIPQEPITEPEVTPEAKPTEEDESQAAVEDTPRAATFDKTESATEAEAPAVVPADINPGYVEPQPAVVEVPAPAEDAPATPVAQNGSAIQPAAVEEKPVSPVPEPAADQEPTPSPIVDASEQTKPVVASPVEEPAAPPDPSPAAEEPIASEPVYDAARHGSLAAVPENEEVPQPPAPVGRPRGLSVHVPEAKPNNTTIIDEANQTEIRPLPPLPQMPAVRTNRSPTSNIRSTSMYLPASPVSPTMTEFAMGAGGVNPPARNSSLRRNIESTHTRIERRIAVSTAGSGAGGTGFGRSGSSGWRALPSAPDVPLPVVSVLPSKMKDRRDSQERSRPKSMADIFAQGEWGAMPDLTLEIPKTPTRLPPSKLLPHPVPSTRPLSSSTLASFMDKQGTVNSTIFDEFPDVPNHIPESQLFSPTEESSNLADSLATAPSPQPTTLSPPHPEEDRTSAASVKSKGSKFRGLSKLMGNVTHSVQRTVSQRRRTSDASQSGSSPGHTYSDKKKHSTVIEPESPLRSTWMEDEKKKSGWASIGIGRRK